VNVNRYLVSRGPATHRDFLVRPAEPWDRSIHGTETVADLRTKLLQAEEDPLQHPIQITVSGTMFPCALLSSGWWERHTKSKIMSFEWRDRVQEWLFNGFDLWGPSWDFTWNFEQWETNKNNPYFIAQLGDGDEANSLPLVIPRDKAIKFRETSYGEWGGSEAEITGLLGHRRHFQERHKTAALELFGGTLDYCLWLDPDNKAHKISLRVERTQLYSGYLWKCVAPKKWAEQKRLCLNDVYFIWEHANFAREDSVKFCLDSLQHKEEYICSMHGEMVVLQKSSSLVPGTPEWAPEKIYAMLLGKKGEDI
jgi:hypothetical protein